jgi:hypothetical protein
LDLFTTFARLQDRNHSAPTYRPNASIDENHKNAGTMIVIGGLARASYKLNLVNMRWAWLKTWNPPALLTYDPILLKIP